MIARVTAEDLEHAQRELRARIERAWQRSPRALNGAAVLDLGDDVAFTWRGRAFRARVDYKHGTRLMELVMNLRAFGADVPCERLDEYRETLRRMVVLFGRVARPRARRGTPRWLRYRLRLYRNPFRHATEGDIGRLAVFFSALRTRTANR